MPESYFSEHDVDVIRFGFMMDGTSYSGEEGAEIDTHEFYERVRKGAMPTTYQINEDVAKAHMERHVREGKDVLAVVFSGGLSGTAECFRRAAQALNEEYPDRKVLACDSLCASMGQGLFLDYAVRKADAGAGLQETFDYLESIKQNMCHYFTVDNLFHLKRGGRVSGATAVLGTLLSIKPLLYVDPEGHLISLSKVVGRKKSIRWMAEKIREMQAMGPDDPIFISHGDCPEDAELLAGMVREDFPGHEITINSIGPVIGTHSGPGTLAIFFFGKQR